jgi:rare lipoprotein A
MCNHLKIIGLILLIILSGCSSTSGRYQQRHDSIPTRLPTASEMEDPIPRDETPSRGGNKDYTVRGKFYQVLADAKGFTQQGIASWYGNKFHGHLTSNGEIYDMYSMTAAHKTLPLPTYVKVTNLDNGRTAIVRVNDRGPFHEDRIIDLSYSAAYKLDMLKTGTARVKIEAISEQNSFETTAESTMTPVAPKPQQVNGSVSPTYYIQVFATQNEQLAQNTAKGLERLYQVPTRWLDNEQKGLFKIQMGPLLDNDEVQTLLLNLKSQGYPQAFIKTEQ